MKLRSHSLAIGLFSIGIAVTASANAQTPDDYVKTEHAKL